jgi:hypothetical protein
VVVGSYFRQRDHAGDACHVFEIPIPAIDPLDVLWQQFVLGTARLGRHRFDHVFALRRSRRSCRKKRLYNPSATANPYILKVVALLNIPERFVTLPPDMTEGERERFLAYLLSMATIDEAGKGRTNYP